MDKPAITIKVDDDFDVVIVKRISDSAKQTNIPPDTKIIAKSTWGRMLWCNKHQRSTTENFCCAICEGEY